MMLSNYAIETDAMPARLSLALAGAAHRERYTAKRRV
jgi:hypothetical protein